MPKVRDAATFEELDNALLQAELALDRVANLADHRGALLRPAGLARLHSSLVDIARRSSTWTTDIGTGQWSGRGEFVLDNEETLRVLIDIWLEGDEEPLLRAVRDLLAKTREPPPSSTEPDGGVAHERRESKRR